MKFGLIGVLVGPGRLSLTVSGPIFGEPLNEPSLPIARENYHFFRQMVSDTLISTQDFLEI